MPSSQHVADKVDFRRHDVAYQGRVGEFRDLTVPPKRYFMIDGHGDPNTHPDFQLAIGALYPAAYAMKFASKKVLGRDYVVPPLEGLWWSDDMSAFVGVPDKSQWSWTLMSAVPDWISDGVVMDSWEAARNKKNPPPRIRDLRIEELAEGRCIQTLHVGTFDDEAAVLRRMHQEIIPALGLNMTGKHHEIYLSDFRRVTPHRQRTLLRQPVA